MARLEIEHIIPRSKGGATEEANLWLCCPLCNRFKADRTEAEDPDTGTSVPLFNPRTQDWFEHFAWTADGIRIIGLTPVGRATVVALHLSDDPDALEVRGYWVLAGWHPQKTELPEYVKLFLRTTSVAVSCASASPVVRAKVNRANPVGSAARCRFLLADRPSQS